MRTAEDRVTGKTERSTRDFGRAAPSVLTVLVIALSLLWPATLNGGPFYMADTPSYVRAADSGFFKLFGVKTAWTGEYLNRYANGADSDEAAPRTPQQASRTAGQIPVTLNGRSIFYGALLYASQGLGSFWLMVFVQSLLAGTCIFLTVNALRQAMGKEPGPLPALLTGLVLAVATPAAYFAGYLMPDLFGGLALLALANLLFLWPSASTRVRAFWTGLLFYALVVHNVNLLLAVVLGIAALLYALLRKIPLAKGRIAAVAGSIVAAILAVSAFGQGVKVLTGAPPVRPPFVAMRLIADGPGYAYLQSHCSSEAYIYCRTLSHQRIPSDFLLWSKDPQVSLFQGLSPDEQRLSAAQERGFLVNVARDQPVAVLKGVLENSFQQLSSFNLAGFNYTAGNKQRFAHKIPQPFYGRMTSTRAFMGTMPTSWIEAASVVLTLVSVIGIGWFLFSTRSDPKLRPVRGFALLLFGGVLANAAICGALSGPKGRYEMRLIWVLPLLAGSIAAPQLRRRRRDNDDGQSVDEANVVAV